MRSVLWSQEETGGIRGVLKIYLSPTVSLEFASGRLVINRFWSVCLTGGSLGFDGRTLISRRTPRRQMDKTTHTSAKNKHNHFIILQMTLRWLLHIGPWHTVKNDLDWSGAVEAYFTICSCGYL